MEPFIFIIPIGIFVYFVIYGLTEKRIENERRRIFNSILGAVILSPLLYFIFIVGIIFMMSREGSRKFDSKEWKSGNEVDANMNKYQMIDDLIDEEILIGLDTIKVKEIIGSPTFRTKEQNSWSYNAGIGGGIGFVHHNLDVLYNNQGKVIKVEHIRMKD